MLGRLREIDDELSVLPDQLGPLEQQVLRGREVLAQSEQNNPMRHPLAVLLKRADRVHVENLGWFINEQTADPAAVAMHVSRFMLAVLGRPHVAGELTPYEISLAEFIRAQGGPQVSPGALEGAMLRKLFAEPWLSADSKVRAHVMETLRREAEQNVRWLPEPRPNLIDEEGRSVVGEGAGAFGGYFTSSALITIGLCSLQLSPPTRAFASINETLAQITDNHNLPRFSLGFNAAAGNNERARALVVVAYIHFIRSLQMGQFEREHRKVLEALGSAEVTLETGKKRVERLRTTRSEIVIQMAGIIWLVVTVLALIGFFVYSALIGEAPLKPPST